MVFCFVARDAFEQIPQKKTIFIEMTSTNPNLSGFPFLLFPPPSDRPTSAEVIVSHLCKSFVGQP